MSAAEVNSFSSPVLSCWLRLLLCLVRSAAKPSQDIVSMPSLCCWLRLLLCLVRSAAKPSQDIVSMPSLCSSCRHLCTAGRAGGAAGSSPPQCQLTVELSLLVNSCHYQSTVNVCCTDRVFQILVLLYTSSRRSP